MTSHLSKFGSYTAEDAAKGRSAESSTGWFKIKPGTNVIRFLPPLVGMTEPWVTIHQHFIKVPGGAKPIVFNCPRRMNNDRCPACEKADRLKATGNPADEKAMKEFWPSARNIGFVIDRDDPDSGIQLCPFGSKIKKRLRFFREKQKKDFTNLETGYDIVIEKSGSGMDTDYQTDPGEQCPVYEDMEKFAQWVEELPDLESFMKVLPYDTILEKFRSAGGAPAAPQRQLAGARGGSSVQDEEDEYDDGNDPY